MVEIDKAPQVFIRNSYGDKLLPGNDFFAGYGVTFVFGSNLQGRHGAGAAKFARVKLGAVPGVSYGRTGNCYALPTRTFFANKLETLSLSQIKYYIDRFISEIRQDGLNNELFYLTKIGCGLAGLTEEEIAPLFAKIPYTVIIPEDWLRFFPEEREILFYKDDWV